MFLNLELNHDKSDNFYVFNKNENSKRILKESLLENKKEEDLLTENSYYDSEDAEFEDLQVEPKELIENVFLDIIKQEEQELEQIEERKEKKKIQEKKLEEIRAFHLKELYLKEKKEQELEGITKHFVLKEKILEKKSF